MLWWMQGVLVAIAGFAWFGVRVRRAAAHVQRLLQEVQTPGREDRGGHADIPARSLASEAREAGR